MKQSIDRSIRVEVIVAMVISGFGGGVLWEGLGLGGFSLSAPGSGAFPTLLGVGLMFLGGYLLYSSLKSAPASIRQPISRPTSRPVLYLALVIAYAFSLRYVSFFVMTPVFILLAMVLLRDPGSGEPVRNGRLLVEWGVLALAVIGICYLLFERLLQVSLP